MSSTDNIDDPGFVLRLGAAPSDLVRPAPPLRAALWTVYATTLVLALLMPHAVENWLDDLPPGPVVDAARFCIEPVARLSDGLGLRGLYDGARRRTEALSKRAE